MAIPIIDLHCDALLQMNLHDYDFKTSPKLHVNLPNLRKGHVRAQAFAIFIEPSLSMPEKLKAALHQVYYFQNHVVCPENGVVHLKEWADFHTLKPGEIGAFLTIEGVDFFDGDSKLWHLFKEFGVLCIGLTWNFANAAADGLYEDLGRGVTDFGKEIITLNNTHKIFTDVSHLTEHSFWDVMEYADYAIASHSNAQAICSHKRNLNDAQLRAMIAKNAPIHLVFCPEFIVDGGAATMKDIVTHIDHICALGGKHLIGFGSDFDGITDTIPGLENAGTHQNLVNELLQHYTEADVNGFAYANFLDRLPK